MCAAPWGCVRSFGGRRWSRLGVVESGDGEQAVPEPGGRVVAAGLLEAGTDLGAALVDPRVEDVLLRREVVEERLPRYVGGLGDLLDAGFVVGRSANTEVQEQIEGVATMSGTDPRSPATTYLMSWKAGDFGTLRGILTPDVTFRGVLGACDGIDETIAGLQGMAGLIADFDIQRMVVEGQDVMTWYDFHTNVCEPMPTVNWSHVTEGKIGAIRAVFDPRPLLAAQSR